MSETTVHPCRATITALAMLQMGCLANGHRNVVPNSPGETSSRVGGVFDPNALPAMAINQAVGIPGNAEVGADGLTAYITKGIGSPDGIAVASSWTFGWFGGFFLGGSEATIVANPGLAHSFLFQSSGVDPWRLDLRAGASTFVARDFRRDSWHRGPVRGYYSLELGRQFGPRNDNAILTFGIVRSDGLFPTGEDQELRGNLSTFVRLTFSR